MKIPVRDGAQMEIQIYKPLNPDPNTLLNFNVHGGGWVVGNHSTEEAQCRKVAYDNKAVVVSPDYRMAPAFRFPYAVNDCFDALKWVSSMWEREYLTRVADRVSAKKTLRSLE